MKTNSDGDINMKIYLAAPYRHSNPSIRQSRFLAANQAAAKLIGMGHTVFSPISHSHPIANCMGNHMSVIWLYQDRDFIDWADCMVILDTPGYESSSGIKQEKKWMREAGKQIFLFSEFTQGKGG